MKKATTTLLLIIVLLTQAAGSCTGDDCPTGTVSEWHCSETAQTCWTVCIEK